MSTEHIPTSRRRRASAALRLVNRWRAQLIDWLFGWHWLVPLALAACADEGFDECTAKFSLATVLIKPDRQSCAVSEADADAVIARLGNPWVVVVTPPESTP